MRPWMWEGAIIVLILLAYIIAQVVSMVEGFNQAVENIEEVKK